MNKISRIFSALAFSGLMLAGSLCFASEGSMKQIPLSDSFQKAVIEQIVDTNKEFGVPLVYRETVKNDDADRVILLFGEEGTPDRSIYDAVFSKDGKFAGAVYHFKVFRFNPLDNKSSRMASNKGDFPGIVATARAIGVDEPAVEKLVSKIASEISNLPSDENAKVEKLYILRGPVSNYMYAFMVELTRQKGDLTAMAFENNRMPKWAVLDFDGMASLIGNKNFMSLMTDVLNNTPTEESK